MMHLHRLPKFLQHTSHGRVRGLSRRAERKILRGDKVIKHVTVNSLSMCHLRRNHVALTTVIKIDSLETMQVTKL